MQGYTDSWNDNEQAGDYNKPCVLVTNERSWKVVVMTRQPMRGRKNVLGWCIGDEVKNLGKDIMETRSGEYGFILYWLECGIAFD